ncbi:MAG TPA: transposase [Flavisolibacter sp.]|nr:transposase [Flavisolibacter sp.]
MGYDAAFKQKVVKMTRAGCSVPDIALSLGVGENIIYRWKREAIESSEFLVSENSTPQVSLSEHMAL